MLERDRSTGGTDRREAGVGGRRSVECVGRDMEDVFGAIPFRGLKAAGAGPRAIGPIARHPRRASRQFGIAGAVVAGVILFVVLWSAWSGRTPPAPTLRPAEQGDVTARLIPSPPIARRVAAAPLVPQPVPSTKSVSDAAGKSTPEPARKSPQLREAGRAIPAAQRAPKRNAAVMSPRLADASCRNLGRMDRARCMRPQVMDADRRLRSAYLDAMQAGVDPRTLTSYHRRWSRIRRQANSDPAYVAASFDQMARQLGAAQREF